MGCFKQKYSESVDEVQTFHICFKILRSPFPQNPDDPNPIFYKIVSSEVVSEKVKMNYVRYL